MINDLSLFFEIGGNNPVVARPIRMGFFHFSNNNLSIRKQCARDIGMYDSAARKAEDVDLCFRVALSPKWVAWRENTAVISHKGRGTLWELVTQMGGYGFNLGYPYAKTAIHGVFLYWLNGRDHTLMGRLETEYFPILVCAFASDFYFINALVLLLIWAARSGRTLMGFLALGALLWLVPRFLSGVRHLGLSTWDTFKLAVVHYLANLSFTTAAFAGGLRHRVILLPSSIFKLDRPEAPLDVGAKSAEQQRAVGIRGADFYAPANDLWIVTCYFNPQSYATRLENYRRFKAVLERSGARLVTVECAFDNQAFVLPGPNVIGVRARDVLWQKERLLNLAISTLPSECRKVAWLDCDVLFQNPNWLVHASKLLDRFALVQPFQEVALLARGQVSCSAESVGVAESFASVFRSEPKNYLIGDFWRHGHTGFAWAARRELLAGRGLYEFCVAGGADHLMAHAACGDWDSPCIDRGVVGSSHKNHFRQWAAQFYKGTRGRIGYVPGTILHLLHGGQRNRMKTERHVELAAFEFDPDRDIRIGHSGALEWNSPKPQLHCWLRDYFARRMEDGESETSGPTAA